MFRISHLSAGSVFSPGNVDSSVKSAPSSRQDCIHGLRHTNATLLIAGGVPLKTVSSRLGHSSISTTGNIYAHAIRSADEAAADTLEDILGKKDEDS